MWTENAMIYALSLGLGSILIMMGTQTSISQLYNTFTTKKSKIFFIFTQHYIFIPLYAVGLVKAIDLDTPRAVGLLLSSVTPPTVAASVTTFMINGDVDLSITSSVTTLISSFIFMPAVFTIQIYMINRDDISLTLPYLQMCGILIYLVILKGIGIFINYKCREKVKIINRFIKFFAISCMIFALVMFGLSKELVKSSFYAGKDWYKHYVSCILLIIGSGIISHISYSILNITDIKERDAILLTSIRKNPGIAITVAALSFKGYLDNKDYNTAFGLVFINAMLLDWFSWPFIVTLRKLRLGYIFYDNTPIIRHNDSLDISSYNSFPKLSSNNISNVCLPIEEGDNESNTSSEGKQPNIGLNIEGIDIEGYL